MGVGQRCEQNAIAIAISIARECVSPDNVNSVLVEGKYRILDTMTTCTKLYKMWKAGTLSESDLTTDIEYLVSIVFVGHCQDVCDELWCK